MTDHRKKTPLIVATEMGEYEYVKLLLENAADAEIYDHGKMAKLYAAAGKHRKILELIDKFEKIK